jgi:hypothetical protein
MATQRMEARALGHPCVAWLIYEAPRGAPGRPPEGLMKSGSAIDQHGVFVSRGSEVGCVAYVCVCLDVGGCWWMLVVMVFIVIVGVGVFAKCCVVVVDVVRGGVGGSVFRRQCYVSLFSAVLLLDVFHVGLGCGIACCVIGCVLQLYLFHERSLARHQEQCRFAGVVAL